MSCTCVCALLTVQISIQTPLTMPVKCFHSFTTFCACLYLTLETTFMPLKYAQIVKNLTTYHNKYWLSTKLKQQQKELLKSKYY